MIIVQIALVIAALSVIVHHSLQISDSRLAYWLTRRVSRVLPSCPSCGATVHASVIGADVPDLCAVCLQQELRDTEWTLQQRMRERDEAIARAQALHVQLRGAANGAQCLQPIEKLIDDVQARSKDWGFVPLARLVLALDEAQKIAAWKVPQ